MDSRVVRIPTRIMGNWVPLVVLDQCSQPCRWLWAVVSLHWPSTASGTRIATMTTTPKSIKSLYF